MKYLVGLLLLVSGISGALCEDRIRQYHLVNEKKNWTDAQCYCREMFDDLATVEDEKENDDIINMLTSDTYNGLGLSWIWIGLQRDDDSLKWTWSDGSNFRFQHWQDGEGSNEKEKCVEARFTGVDKYNTEFNGVWNDNDCVTLRPFLCQNNTLDCPPLVLVKENKTWAEAVNYCREHHYELVSINDEDMLRCVQKKAQSATTPHVWLGLHFTCTLDFWYWLSGVSYSCQDGPWGNEPPAPKESCGTSAAMEKGCPYDWDNMNTSDTLNFICEGGD